MNISVELAPNQIKFLNRMVQRGDYRSRSEAVRDVIRRAEFEWAWVKSVEEAAQKALAPSIQKERKAAFGRLRRRFGDAL